MKLIKLLDRVEKTIDQLVAKYPRIIHIVELSIIPIFITLLIYFVQSGIEGVKKKEFENEEKVKFLKEEKWNNVQVVDQLFKDVSELDLTTDAEFKKEVLVHRVNAILGGLTNSNKRAEVVLFFKMFFPEFIEAFDWKSPERALKENYIRLSFQNFYDVQLDQFQFEQTILRNVNFSVSSLIEMSFAHSVLIDINFTKANLSGATFSRSTLKNLNFSGATLTHAKFLEVNFESTIDFKDAILNGADFRGLVLVGVNFTRAKLKNAKFQEATLIGSDLSNADLSGANLKGAVIKFKVEDKDLYSIYGKNVGPAKFNSTILNKTIWVDGDECHPHSIDDCIKNN